MLLGLHNIGKKIYCNIFFSTIYIVILRGNHGSIAAAQPSSNCADCTIQPGQARVNVIVGIDSESQCGLGTVGTQWWQEVEEHSLT